VPRPYIFTHTLVSVDGRLEGFPPDVGRYYDLASRVSHQAVLSGSGTMVAAATAAGIDLADVDGESPRASEPGGESTGPLLVVVDSRGQLTRFDWLRTSGYFADVLVLGSQRTSEAHRQRLRAAGVDLEVVGTERVDLEAALAHLHEQRGIEAIRVDAGPGLNGALLAAGLLDEVSVLLAPYLVGDGRTFLEGLAGHPATRLELASAESQPDGHVWLRYTIGRA
jgi:2,5-diamino-6-(ribosylamino)-4(3H)-pyrimidinone 5'-phosphate reductase